MNNKNDGVACGPFSVYAIDAEIVVEDEGNTVYLHTQWVDAASDMILFEATTESIYDIELEITDALSKGDEAFDDAISKRNTVQEENGCLQDIR